MAEDGINHMLVVFGNLGKEVEVTSVESHASVDDTPNWRAVVSTKCRPQLELNSNVAAFKTGARGMLFMKNTTGTWPPTPVVAEVEVEVLAARTSMCILVCCPGVTLGTQYLFSAVPGCSASEPLPKQAPRGSYTKMWRFCDNSLKRHSNDKQRTTILYHRRP